MNFQPIKSILKQLLQTFGLLLFGFFLFNVIPGISKAQAAASLYVSAPASVRVNDVVTITVGVNTGGAAANAFEASFSYPAGSLEGTGGSYAGSICTLPITQPVPSGGSATISCGTPSGFTGSGTVATMTFKASSAGTVSLGLSGCSVLANDGMGTDITGSCSGRSITINAATETVTTPSDAPVTTITTPTPTPKTTTTKTTSTPKTSSSPKAAESPKSTPPPTETASTPPPVQTIEETPTPSSEVSASPDTQTASTANSQKRSILQAIKDSLGALKGIKSAGSQVSGLIAVLLILLPILALVLAIVYMLYRLYILERRRRRTLDRLFEMELSEFASLEGKMDVLSTKGAKGREEYEEEFSKAKERILRQLRPDFNKPVDSTNKVEAAVVGKSEDAIKESVEKPANPAT